MHKKSPAFTMKAGPIQSRNSRILHRKNPYEVVAAQGTTRQLSSGNATSLASTEIIHKPPPFH
jgi:hypothetical protein